MAETDTGADIPAEDSVQEPPAGKRKKSRAGRNLPAAIAVGAAIGLTIVAILVWDRYLWVFLLAAAMPLATHEVVRRLREAGYVIPVIPLLAGGELMIWLAWYHHAVGALAGFGITAVVCMFWRLALGASSVAGRIGRLAVGELSARRRGHGFRSGLGAAVRVVQRAAGLSAERLRLGCSA